MKLFRFIYLRFRTFISNLVAYVLRPVRYTETRNFPLRSTVEKDVTSLNLDKIYVVSDTSTPTRFRVIDV